MLEFPDILPAIDMVDASIVKYSAHPEVISHATRVLHDKICNVNGREFRYSELKQKIAAREVVPEWDIAVKFRSVPWRETGILPLSENCTDADLEKCFTDLARKWTKDETRVGPVAEYIREVDNGHLAALLALVPSWPELTIGLGDWLPARVHSETGAAHFRATVSVPRMQTNPVVYEAYDDQGTERDFSVPASVHTGMLPPDRCAGITLYPVSASRRQALHPDLDKFFPDRQEGRYPSLVSISVADFPGHVPSDSVLRETLSKLRRYKKKYPVDACAIPRALAWARDNPLPKAIDLNKLLDYASVAQEINTYSFIARLSVGKLLRELDATSQGLGDAECGDCSKLVSIPLTFASDYPRAATLGVQDIVLHVNSPGSMSLLGCCMCVHEITVVMSGEKLDQLYQTNLFSGRFWSMV